jgi:hypothetical protein
LIGFRRSDAKLGIGLTILSGGLDGSPLQLRDGVLRTIRESMRGSVIDGMDRKRSG